MGKGARYRTTSLAAAELRQFAAKPSLHGAVARARRVCAREPPAELVGPAQLPDSTAGERDCRCGKTRKDSNKWICDWKVSTLS